MISQKFLFFEFLKSNKKQFPTKCMHHPQLSFTSPCDVDECLVLIRKCFNGKVNLVKLRGKFSLNPPIHVHEFNAIVFIFLYLQLALEVKEAMAMETLLNIQLWCLFMGNHMSGTVAIHTMAPC